LYQVILFIIIILFIYFYTDSYELGTSQKSHPGALCRLSKPQPSSQKVIIDVPY